MDVEAVERFKGLPREQQLKNPIMIQLVTSTVAKNMNRPLQPQEIRRIQSNIVQLRPDRAILDADIRGLVASLARVYTEQLEGVEGKVGYEVEYDLKSLQNREIGINSENNQVVSQFELESLSTQQATYTNLVDVLRKGISVTSIAGQTDPYDILQLVNPRQQWVHAGFYIDSRNRAGAGTGLMYNVTVNIAQTANVVEGSVNNINVVRDIIRVTAPELRIPKPLNTTTVNPINQYNLITLQFVEFGNVGMIGRQQRNFQFLFKPVANNNFIDLQPMFKGMVEFVKPSNINSFTAVFGSPLNQIIFDPDRKRVTFTYGAVTTVVVDGQEAHYLTNNDLVSFDQFTTAAVSADASVIATMNGTAGLQVTVINAYTFTIPVNTATVTPTVGLNIFCYFDSKRIFCPIDVEYVEPKAY